MALILNRNSPEAYKLSHDVNLPRKRPLGITLLALTFLWIGCIGTLIFPIMIPTGGVSLMWDSLTSTFIHSDAFRLAGLCLFTLAFFGTYVLYAFIGFGLWKLRKWAWKAVVVVQWIGVCGGALGGLITALHNAAMGIALLGILAPYAGILWYLYRPGVKAAFGLMDNDGTAGVSPPPKPSSKRTVAFVIGMCVLGIAVFAGALFVSVENMMRSSDAYKIALSRAQASPCVIDKIGTPTTAGFGITGDISESSDDGSADLEIPLHGPKGKTTLEVSASKAGGVWTMKTLSLNDGPDLLTNSCAAK